MGMEVESGGQRQLRGSRDNADVEVAVCAQFAASGRAGQDCETERRPGLEGTAEVVNDCGRHEASIEQAWVRAQAT